MPYTINEIESLVIDALNVAPLNTYCKNVLRYDGQLAVDISQIKTTFPAIFVTYNGDRMIENSPLHRYTKEMSVSVIVVAKDLRSDYSGKTGAIGVYRMLDDIQSILHLNALGKPDIVGMVLKRRVPLLNTRTLAAFGLDFTLQFIA